VGVEKMRRVEDEKKLQITKYKLQTNYKLQITKKEEPNSQPMQSCKQSMQPPLTTHHSPMTND
jgi:hypothetical protein